MNPLALILLLGLGVAAINTMANNYTGNKLEVKILQVDSFKLTLEGLEFNFLVQVTNPFSHELEFIQAVVGAEYNKDKFLRTLKQGANIKIKQSQYSYTSVVPYAKILTLLPALTQNKLTNTSIILSIEIQAGGYKGSDSKTFKLDSLAQDTTKKVK